MRTLGRKRWRLAQLLAVAVGSVCLFYGAEPAKTSGAGTLTDKRDGKKYRTVAVGSQRWMAENLNYQAPRGSWCYNDSASNCGKYGRLYDWNTAMDVCPAGWHLPSRPEWDTLVAAAGGYKEGAGKKLKAKSGWKYYKEQDKSGDGTDDYGFSALPGGGFSAQDIFYNTSELGAWWTSSENAKGEAYNQSVIHSRDDMYRGNYHKNYAFSVRCLEGESDAAEAKKERVYEPRETEKKKLAEQRKKEIEKSTAYFTDSRDDQRYRTVKIGRQTWMAQNLNYQTDSSWCFSRKDDYCGMYGRLYTWNAAKDACPSGWHLPTRDEWNVLIATAGGDSTAGQKLRAGKDWSGKNDGTDEYGFAAKPGGDRSPSGGNGIHLRYGYWWTATANGDSLAYSKGMSYNKSSADENSRNKGYGFSVRCMQNN